jgi:4a-hydroxytetrahydrobiopterin dehydratase
MKPLTDEELAAALQGLSEWDGDAAVIHRTVAAPDFLAALAIVQEVGLAAEAANHHPDIDIRWRKVTFALSTHDVGGKVSELDVAMAKTIDEVARKHGA